MLSLKKDFPLLLNHPDLVYLDSAATTQKPESVINAVSDFYTKSNSNIHRGVYQLAEKATEIYENTRIQTGEFINARSSDEIIFTLNTNYSINQIAFGWAKKFMNKGDILILSEMEHNANFVPWIKLQELIGIEIIYLPIDPEFRLDLKMLKNKNPDFDTNKIKLISLTYASNILGTLNPLDKIIPMLKKSAPQALISIDAAQAIPHIKPDVQKADVDFFAFSSHKMLGPSGIGVLWAKKQILETMDPLIYGSNMVRSADKNSLMYSDLPFRFEAGTPGIEAVAGFSQALSYITKIGYQKIREHELDLSNYTLQKLKNLDFIKLIGPDNTLDRIGVFSFNIKNAHPHDVSQILDHENIAIRAGHHCSPATLNALNTKSACRASLYIYNTREDIDKLIDGLKKVKKTLKI